MDLVSIIVPVYNSEKYLEKCISSIFNQSYQNIEIILIDDGSTDDSKIILDKWKNKDERIKILSQKNSGVAEARNRGLDIAKGKYICFFDSDDWIEKDMIFTMQNELSKMSVDLVYCNFFYEYTTVSIKGIKSDNTKKIIEKNWNNNDFYFHYLSPYSSCGIITNKMFCADIINKNNLRFLDSSKVGGEDSLFNLSYFTDVKKTVFINEIFYHYIQREESEIHKNRPEIINNYVTLIEEFYNYLKKYNYLNLKPVIPHLFYHYYTLGIETTIRNEVENDFIIEYMKKARSKLGFKNLMKEYIKHQLSKKNHFGNLSRRIRTIFFSSLSILNSHKIILFLSKKWLRLRKSNKLLRYGLHESIELKTSPLVSIIIPVFNSEKFIEKTIKSVKQQTYKNWELIIIDDGSTDKSLNIIKDLAKDDDRIKIHHNSKNMGVCFSRNSAIKKSNGEWIAFLDSDDIWTKQKLEIQIKETENFGKKFIFSNIIIKKEDFNLVINISEIPKKITYDNLKKKNIIPLSTVLIKKSLLNDLKFERDELHEDYILWLKILSKGNFAYGINKPLTIIRIRNDSRSSKKIKSILKTYKGYRFIGIDKFKSIQYTVTNSLRALKKYIYLEVHSKYEQKYF